MKRAVAIILVALLLLAALTYTVGYGHDQLSRSSNPNLSNRRTQIIEMYSKKRDGPDLSSIKSTWINVGEQRLGKCQTEISLWWTRMLERVNAF